VTGRVARLATFGAFVRLGDGIEGLIHVSEMSDRHVPHPRNVVHEGDVVTARVLRVEPERRRLGLSLRDVEQPDDGAAADES
jgi:small subunit ribosomal protein S1